MLKTSKNWSVGEWMTPNPASIHPDSSVKKALIQMKQGGYRHLLVIEKNLLVGIISDRDLRRSDADIYIEAETESIDCIYRLSHTVRSVMTRDVKTVLVDDYMGTALVLFRTHRFGALPVINNEGTVVGILSVHDALNAFGDALESLGSIVIPNITGSLSDDNAGVA